MVKSILFVCMGNICRSPALQSTLEQLAKKKGIELHVESCGIGRVSIGQGADPRSVYAASQVGIEIKNKAQSFQSHFFTVFDAIFAVDGEILQALRELGGPDRASKIHLATKWSRQYKDQPIGEPYYLGEDGFTLVMDQVVDSCKGIIDHLNEIT